MNTQKQSQIFLEIEAKLQNESLDEKMEAIEMISFCISENKQNSQQQSQQEFLIWLNNIMLKLADLIVSSTINNLTRSKIIKKIFEPHSSEIQKFLINKDEFLSRISCQFNTNDPEQRINSLKIISCCPFLIQDRLDVQH